MKRREKIKLIDDTHFAVQRVKPYERKPDEAIDSKAHRKWIASLSCHACGTRDRVEAAHLRKGAGQPKGGDKKDDFWCWPGCFRCHELIQHSVGEDSFWERLLEDPDRWRTVLERYGIKSPVPHVAEAARAEWGRRYG